MSERKEKAVPTPKHASILLALNKNGGYYLKSTKKIRKTYAGKIIAIYNQRVIESKKKIDELFDVLRKKFDETELRKTYVVYVPQEKEVLIV